MDAPAATVSRNAPGRGGAAVLALAIWGAAMAGAVAVTTDRAFDLDRFFIPKELGLHAAAFVAALVLASRMEDRRHTRVDLALLAWLGLSALSALGATSGWHAVRAVSLSLSGAVVFWAASALRDTERGRRVVFALSTAAMLAAASALAQAYGYKADLFASTRAPGGLLGNRNFIAHVSAIALPLLVYTSATARSSLGALWGASGILVTSAALVLSRTRAAWLALAVWFVLALPIAWRGRGVIRTAMAPRRGALLAGALAVGTLLALVLPNSLDWKSETPYLDSVRGVVNYREGSGAGRLKQYENSLKLARAHPLVGVGPGNWAAEYPRVAVRNDPSISESTGMTSNPWPSSDWVAAIAERGVPAAMALFAFVALLLANAWRGWNDSVYSSRERFAALAGGSALLIGVVEGGFDAVTLLAFPSVLVWGAAGALIPSGRAVMRRASTPRARRWMLVGAGTLWALIVLVTVGKFVGMHAYSRGTFESVRAAATVDPGSYRIQLRAAELEAARGQCGPAVQHARAAQGLFPHAAAPQAILAKCAGAQR